MRTMLVLSLLSFFTLTLKAMNEGCPGAKRSLIVRQNSPVKKESEEDFHVKKRCIDKPLIQLKCDLLAQIFSMRVASDEWDECEHDDILVSRVLELCNTIDSSSMLEKKIIRRLFASDIYHCLVRRLVNEGLTQKAQRQNHLDFFFEESFRNFAALNIEFLLKNGANPHIALPKFEDDRQGVHYYGVTQLAYEGDLNRLRFLLRFGASVDIAQYEENPLISALQGETLKQPETINMLLYYGADPNLKLKSYRRMRPLGITPLQAAKRMCTLFPRSKVLDICYKLCRDGHARRVYRMAHYLKKITKLPLDVNFLFAEYLYGRKLDKSDRVLFDKLRHDDYKKNRTIIS